jgi:hypothetical protein
MSHTMYVQVLCMNLRANADLLNRGCPYADVFGFVDGTFIRTTRPSRFQRLLYNGKEKYVTN